MSLCAEQKTKDLAALATIMAAARQTSLENEHSHYFAIIPSCSHFTMLARNPTTGLVCAPLINKIPRTKDFLYAQVVIKTLTLLLLRCCFAENSTDLFISACCTCSTLIFPQSTNQILNLCPCRCRCCS